MYNEHIQTPKRTQEDMPDTLLKSSYGSVKPYTRHVAGCSKGTNENDCGCPKWLYEYKRGGKPIRRSLVTPSWAEAQRIASDTLRGFDPEIAKARAAEQKREAQRITVEDACKRWLDHARKKNGETGVLPSYRSLANKIIDWATRQRFLFIQDVTTAALDAWSSSKEWTHYSPLTQRQRWANLRNMFAYLTSIKILDENPAVAIKPITPDSDPVQGPYTDEQVEAMYAHVLESLEGDPKTRQLRATRLRTMLTFLLRTGADLIDAAQFEQSHIEAMQIDERQVWVYQYHRSKTGVLAVVPLTDDVVREIREVPLMAENDPEMPFRSSAADAFTDARFWGHRIQRLLKIAEVKWVELPTKDRRGRPQRKAANAKQLRHTFAVRQLLAGQPPEAVARMLGHVDATMVRKHYAPFVPALKERHVRLVLENWR
jgi:integrase